MNATYVQPSDATFVAPSTGSTVDSNETFQVEAAPMKVLIQHDTMVLDRPASGSALPRISACRTSIMTDDISDDEGAVVAATPQKPHNLIIRSAAKNNKELFK